MSEAGFDTDQWVGNACITGSGRRLVVVYAPRTFTNTEALSERGGFTAVVDLLSGAVTKLPVQTSLAYFNPGCGAGETAVLTQEGGSDSALKTRLTRLDASAGRLTTPVEVAGQLTSAVPSGDGIIGADSGGLVRVNDKGGKTLFAATPGVPFDVVPDAEGGVVFMGQTGAESAAVYRAAGAAPGGNAPAAVTTLASGQLSQLGVARGAAGKVFLTGKPGPVAGLPKTVTYLNVAGDAQVSSLGRSAITSVGRADQPDPRQPVSDPTRARPVQLQATVIATGKSVSFTVDPDASRSALADTGRATAPTLTATATRGIQTAGSANDPVDADRFCSVPRNDAGSQALQPLARQVEWAADQAVRGVLDVQRPANWKNLGMPAYSPQGLFPRGAGLDGGGYVPAQILLGVASVESNLWQASNHVLPGETGNPLVGNFYGRPIYDDNPGNDWDINWANSDCGYGVMQQTDHMRLAGHERSPEDWAWSYQVQRAVALDFATNIAAGLHVLEEKWNLLSREGIHINSGDPQYIENWFFAVWAYNSGFHPNLGDGSPWGLGWLNNPANPRYPPARSPFLETSYDDARLPQHWPYEEKVIGWAGHPIESIDAPNHSVPGFRAAWWNNESWRSQAKPFPERFCNFVNECEMGGHFPNNLNEPAGPCKRPDLTCWYHNTVIWKDNCAVQCGNEKLRFDPGYPYQDDGSSYPPNCNYAQLPAGTLVVDDVPQSVGPVRACGSPGPSRGTFSFDFAPDANGLYTSKVDFHQVGGGYGAHFWFAHTRQTSSEGYRLLFSGSWTLSQPLNSWARVLVHVPDHGAQTQQARYDISLGDGKVETRYLNQRAGANKWVSLGVYPFAGTGKVSLSSITRDGRGEEDIAWDAVAFQPLPDKPHNVVAALGDSYSSGEGASSYDPESDNNHGSVAWNACRRSVNAWPRYLFGYDLFSSAGELSFAACSGATTWMVDGSDSPAYWTDPSRSVADGEFGEINQIESGAVNEYTTLVVLTIGGNDNGAFVNALKDCASSDCYGEDFNYLPRYRSIIDQNQVAIARTIRAIHRAAPSAKILLVGYPRLFSNVNPGCAYGIDGNEQGNINSLADYMADKENGTVATLHGSEGIPVFFADARQAIGAGQGVCAGTAELINGPRVGANGDGDFHHGDPESFCFWPIVPVVGGDCVSRESFHPKLGGERAIGDFVSRRLLEIS